MSESDGKNAQEDMCVDSDSNAAKMPKLMDISAIPKLMQVATGHSQEASQNSQNRAGSDSKKPLASAPLPPTPQFDPSITLEQIRAAQHKFIDDRDWHRYHTPRNLLLAMVGEVGELSELFQWRGEVKVGLPGWSADDKLHLRQELADVFLYLLRLSEQCGVDLPVAVMEKIALNSKKYPADVVRGSSRKYSDYPEGTKLAKPHDDRPSGDD